jgi:uncharacterized damage-inducible protein DinB
MSCARAPRRCGNPFWQQVLHALAGIQFWFRESREEFSPPDFGRGPVPDLDRIPEFNVDRKTVEDYLNALRERVDSFFGSLDDSRLLSTSTLYDKCTYADLILMQVRHIQHHVGYLNCVLRAAGAGTVTWRGYAE